MRESRGLRCGDMREQRLLRRVLERLAVPTECERESLCRRGVRGRMFDERALRRTESVLRRFVVRGVHGGCGLHGAAESLLRRARIRLSRLQRRHRRWKR